MNSVENANSQSHEWLREINHLLPLRGNRQPRHCQIGFLEREESRDEDPEPGKRQGRGHSTPRAMHPIPEGGCPIPMGRGAFAAGQDVALGKAAGVFLVMSMLTQRVSHGHPKA